MPIVDDKLKLVQNAATFEGLFNAVSDHPSTGTKFFKDDLTWDVIPKQFQSIVTVAKTGYADFVCSDTAYTSDDKCIQAALDYVSTMGGGKIVLGDGNFLILTQISYTGSNLTFQGGAKSVIDRSSLTGSASCFTVGGSISATNAPLATDTTTNTLTITVATGQGTKFHAGDWIRIRSEEIFDESATWTQTAGEIQQIESVAEDVITLKERLLGGYKTTDNATVDIVDMTENIIFKDFKIVGAVTTGDPVNEQSGLNIHQAHNVIIDHVSTDDVYSRSIILTDVVGSTISNCIARRSKHPGVGYGLCVMNASRDITGIGNHYYNCRHGITCGGGHYYGFQYNQTYIGNTMSHDENDIGMFGMHPSYTGLSVVGNTTTGSSLGFFDGKNTIVDGNHVQSIDGNQTPNLNGYALSLPTCCETAIISNNIIESNGNCGIAVKTEKSDITITGNIIKCNTVGFPGITVTGDCNQVVIEKNNITSVAAGIYFNTVGSTRNITGLTIAGNHITTSSGIGIDVGGSTPGFPVSNVKISNNVINAISDGVKCKVNNYPMTNLSIENNTITVPGTQHCIYLLSTGPEYLVNVDIFNNICHGGLDSVDIDKCTKINLIGNSIYNAAARGVVIRGNNTYYTVSDNRLIACVSVPAIANAAGTTGRVITNNIGYNPVGNFTAPTVPASTVAYTNNYGYPCQVHVSGGTVTEITLDGVATGMSTFFGIIPPGGTIAITYSSAPTWKWWGL